MDEAGTAQTDIRPVTSKNKLAFWFFLGGEVILFGTLILTYAVTRISYPDQYSDFRSHLSIPLIGVNTFVLILSSYFVVRTFLAAKRKQLRSMQVNLLIVLALGALFIGGQAYEWSALFGEGIKLDSTFGSPFFIVTGVHGAHVLIGLAWASIALVFTLSHTQELSSDHMIEIFGLYWHFVDIVWIVLFSVIYLL